MVVTFRRYTTTQKYLLLTNSVSAFLWLSVFLRFVILFPLVGTKFLPGGMADFFLSVQFLLLLELGSYLYIFRNAAMRRRGPKLLYIVLGVFTRLVIGYGVIWQYPKVARNNAFPLLVATQSLAEMFRYIYIVYKVRTFGLSSRIGQFLKSFATVVLFPARVVAEMALMFAALPYADAQNPRFALFLRFLLLVYVPAFYFIYTSTFRLGSGAHQKEN